MSLRNLNNPPLVALAGATLSIGLPMLDAALSSSASLILLKSLNVAAFATNVIAVSAPGRLDGVEDQEMRKGKLNPTQSNESTPLTKSEPSSAYALNHNRTLVNPSGWAFTIWAPIYLGEAAFVTAQVFASDASTTALLPHVTAPFIAANLFQSLWCASFRPSFSKGWERYISVAMLAGTGYCLSLVQSAGSAVVVADSSVIPYFLTSMTVHFGWVSAATLVNLNGSLASNEFASTRSLIALGHSSALIATALGVGLTIARSIPAYGLTLAWALAACADGMAKRTQSSQSLVDEETFSKAAGVQKILCWAGSFACASAAAYSSL
ncbi:hypothetical protein ACHAXA_009527 [Cyclostephanos tholiformis]|uniref:Uncharacterized protein n=1 Tax=Cyclostephanos tholiformis TaxID=382380 RepID=A0ABD3RYG9_9STRA